MRRKTFDVLTSAVGLALAVIMLLAGGLLLWGHNFINNEVHNQLAAQKIVFPANNSPAIKAPEFAAMHQYAGQLMTTGAQAEVYADHFIANHLKAIGGGLTYSQLSAKAIAEPTNVALANQVQLMFRGTTLRSMLLNAYAFGTMGMLAGIAAIVAFAGGLVLLILSALGFAHERRVPAEAEIFAKVVTPNGKTATPAPAAATSS
jgi:hypothetical protein